VSEKVAFVATLETDAVTAYGPPKIPLATRSGALAWPEALVMAVAVAEEPNDPLGPDEGAENVTVNPGSGLPNKSVTVATKGLGKVALTSAVCPLPLAATMACGPLLVSEKLAFVATPETDAVTRYGPPKTLLATRSGALAWPEALVMAVAAAEEANNPLGPDEGAENVTVNPGSGLPNRSVTVATRGLENAALMRVVCPPPLAAAME
jgi:hypothetical protein